MARMARGKLLTLLQDDEGGPKQCDWISQVNAQVECAAAHRGRGSRSWGNQAEGSGGGMLQELFALDAVTGALG